MGGVVEAKEAATILEKRAIKVQLLPGPQGFRFQLTIPGGEEYQFSSDELCELKGRGKLTVRGIKELAEEIRKANEE